MRVDGVSEDWNLFDDPTEDVAASTSRLDAVLQLTLLMILVGVTMVLVSWVVLRGDAHASVGWLSNLLGASGG